MGHVENCQEELNRWLEELARFDSKREVAGSKVITECEICSTKLERIKKIRVALKRLKATTAAEAGSLSEFPTLICFSPFFGGALPKVSSSSLLSPKNSSLSSAA